MEMFLSLFSYFFAALQHRQVASNWWREKYLAISHIHFLPFLPFFSAELFTLGEISQSIQIRSESAGGNERVNMSRISIFVWLHLHLLAAIVGAFDLQGSISPDPQNFLHKYAVIKLYESCFGQEYMNLVRLSTY